MIRRLTTIAIISAFLAAPALAQGQKALKQAQRQQQQLKKALKQGKGKTKKQTGRAANQADAQQIQKLQRALNLTDSQAAEVRGLLATQNQELAQLKAAGKGQRKQDVQAVRGRFQMSLRGLLSPDQIQTLDGKRNGKKARVR